MNLNLLVAAFNTLEASWLELKLVKLFGKKESVVEGNTKITISRYKGKYYLINKEN